MELVNGVPVVGSDERPTGATLTSSPTRRPVASAARPQGDFFNTISHTAISPPLDYSFQDIKNMSELIEHEPVGGRKLPASSKDTAASASSPTNGSTTKSVQVQSATSPANVVGRKNPKVLITGIRLSYNELTSLKGFAEALEAVLGPDHRTNLTWLDLSHNQLTTIDDVLTTYPNLTSLYLHGNQISSIHEIKKLNVLVNLQKLTVHGNPIYQARANHGLKNPRSGIIYHLRNCLLKSLDFITITNADRRNSLRWAEQNKPKKKRRPAEEGEGEGR